MGSRLPSYIVKLIFICVACTSLLLFTKFYNSSQPTEHTQDIVDCMRKFQEFTTIQLQEATSVLNVRNQSKDAVYFIETTGIASVKPRFVCSLESTASAYPNADVYLLMVYSPTVLFRTSKNEALYTVLKHHANIQVLYVNMDLLFLGSPMEEFHLSGKLKTSRFIEAHTADVIRFFILWKYGGKYMDLDTLTVRNLTYKNYIIPEVDNPGGHLHNGFMAYEKNFKGALFIFKHLTEHFDGQDWYANGPSVWTKAMVNYTGAVKIGEMNSTNLKEFVKLDYFDLFPIEWFELNCYFNETRSDEAMEKIKKRKNLIGMHFGNNGSKWAKIFIGSKQALGLIAQKLCPRAYWSCFKEFN